MTLELGETSHLNFFSFLILDWVFEKIKRIWAQILFMRINLQKYGKFSLQYKCLLWALSCGTQGLLMAEWLVTIPFLWNCQKSEKTLGRVEGREEISDYFGENKDNSIRTCFPYEKALGPRIA